MKWVSAISFERGWDDAVSDCVASLKAQLGGDTPDLGFIYVSPHHHAGFGLIAHKINKYLKIRHVIGCTGGGVIGAGKEAENRGALSLTAAVLPDVEILPFHLEMDDLPKETEPDGLIERIGAGPDASFILLPEPYSFDAGKAVQIFDMAWPGRPKVGGLASGGSYPGAHALFMDNQVHRSGMVGVALEGSIRMDTVVAQGCRPIGSPMFITRCVDNVLIEINGVTPKQALRDLFETLGEEDQNLFRHSLFLGLEMTMKEDTYKQGDFLIRNIMGLDPTTGYMQVGAHLQETAVAQFHLRDAQTSREDLQNRLDQYKAKELSPTQGALIFSCLGRGEGLYGAPNQDTACLLEMLGPISVGGFFCSGEIGPVQGQTHVHGYTSSICLFGQP